jgi:hypothetical protein
MKQIKNKKFTIKKRIFFSLIVLGLFLLALELLSYTALSLLYVPMPVIIAGDAYMTPDPDLGWIFAPGASNHIVNDRNGFDITIHTGNAIILNGDG